MQAAQSGGFDRVYEIFQQARELDVTSRDAFVRRQVGDDATLLNEVMALLRSEVPEDRCSLVDAVRAGATLVAQGGQALTRIGAYRVLRALGEGGMGTVYLAEQEQPVKRLVALKVIKLGMDSKAVVQRFEQERQALAMMSHDGIARIYDCGTTDRGQPFFAMEYVEGLPLTRFCDEHRLSLSARLNLMQNVCGAVTHAHQKGVVHRDLKPSNVLVSQDSSGPRIKIIDFGLAKAMGSKLVEAALLTETGHMVGTPEYMAPEQADPNNQDIDTRADVYSLGVMLYEVLVGDLPFSSVELRHAGMLGVQRILREVEPPKPSTRLSMAGPSSGAIATARRLSPSSLQRALKSDLDWIVLRAIEKDRVRRYQSANGLAEDLRRYLEHEPLSAGPPTVSYRIRKMLRRYRGQLIAAGLVLTTAICGGSVAVVFAIKATSALREFDQLSCLVHYDNVMSKERGLYPPWPHKIGAMEAWLRDDAGKLLAMRPVLDETVRDLEQRSLPRTGEDIESDRGSHALFPEYELHLKRVATLRYAQAIRDGAAILVEPSLPPEVSSMKPEALVALAWRHIVPRAAYPRFHGEEAFALSCARSAAAKLVGQANEYQALTALAWALLANGQDADAKMCMAAAVSKAPKDKTEETIARQRELDAAVATAPSSVGVAERHLVSLSKKIDTRRTFRFERDEQQFLHAVLVELQGKLGKLASQEVAAVQQRLWWAGKIRTLSLDHPNAMHTWDEVRRGIAGDGPYKGIAIELRDEDVMGLVPIGVNPATGLWEFYELRSAWDGVSDPATIPIPEAGADGRFEVGDDSGLIMVLLPGGVFYMGSQSTDPSGVNYDRHASESEGPITRVQLTPFFLSKYEMTQGQWSRMWSGDQSLRDPSNYSARKNVHGMLLSNPVESVTWASCDSLLRQQGLILPTEAQWEYACRSGSTSPWACPLESLFACENVADRSARDDGVSWPCEAWDDGHTGHARVGSFRANAFGLHDMGGNVSEFCREGGCDYSDEPRPGDGMRIGSGESVLRTARGGAYCNPAVYARSAKRGGVLPATVAAYIGLRPARLLRP